MKSVNFFIVFFSVLYKYLLIDTQSRFPIINFSLLALIVVLSILKVWGEMIAGLQPNFLKWNFSVFVILLFVLFFTYISKDANYILPLLLAIVFSYESIKEFMKYFFYSSVICFFLHLMLVILGIISTPPLYRMANGIIVERHTLGFPGSPNNVFLFFFPIILSAHYLIETNKQRLLYCIISFISIFIIFRITGSRTGFYLITVYLGIAMINIQKLFSNKPLIFVVRYSYYIIAILTVGISMLKLDPSSSVIIKFMTGRPYIWTNYLYQSGIPILGRGVVKELNPETILPQYGSSVDNYFLFLLLNLGWIGFFFFGHLYYFLFKKLQKTNQNKLILMVVFFLLYGFTEEVTLIPSINFTLTFLFIHYLNPHYFQNTNTE